MEVGGRAKLGARAENRSVYVNHEDSSTEVIYRMYCMPILQEQKSVTQPSRKKCIFRGARYFNVSGFCTAGVEFAG